VSAHADRFREPSRKAGKTLRLADCALVPHFSVALISNSPPLVVQYGQHVCRAKRRRGDQGKKSVKLLRKAAQEVLGRPLFPICGCRFDSFSTPARRIPFAAML
jgi:hypothetical protein